MVMAKARDSRLIICIFFSGWINVTAILCQTPVPPIPVELFFGNRQLYFQMVVKKSFAPKSKFDFFSVATYTSEYDPQLKDYNIVIPAQVSYDLGKGFGIMGGTDINSATGWAPVAGPQFNFASRKWLAVSVISYFFNSEQNVKLFGLYEYKPTVSEHFTLYNRIQLMYIQNLHDNLHARSYLYLRTGIKWKSFIFGVASNLDRFGPGKIFKENYGLFFRWELN